MAVASAFDDVLDGFKAGSRANWNAYADVLRSLDSTTYRSYSRAMGTTLKAADPSVLKTFTNAVDDDTLVAVLRNADDDVAQALVRNMDDVALARVAKVDPALARKLNFSVVKFPGLPDIVMRQGGTTAQATKVSEATSSMMKNQGAINAAKRETVTLDTAKKSTTLNATDDTAEAVAVTWVRNKAGVVESVPDADLAEAIRNGGEIVQNSGTVRKALEKLGIIAVGSDVATFTRKHWMKMGAAMVILCMAYDTNNPFTALDRALDDVDEIVDGLKDLADSATEAAGNAAKGTFDLIAFLTENWWMSFACCVMLLFIGVAATLS
jgi:hypothetical protein